MTHRKLFSVATLLVGTFLQARPGFGTDRLALNLVDTYHLMPTGAPAAAGQVAEIFAAIGVDVDWIERATTALPDARQAELLVYLRKNGPEEIGLSKNVLGAVLSHATPERILFVFLPAIADTVGVELGGMLSAEDERKLARALARVIVHEAVHAIAPKLPHAKKGLTRERLTSDALLRGHAQIDAGAARVFRRHLARLRRKTAEQRIPAFTPSAPRHP